MYKSSNNKQVTLDNVNLKEEISNMKGIAIMLEQDDGTYKESSTNTFPTDMKFNNELSGCIDNLGNKIANSLTYENGIANVETSNTSYCYLYFNNQSDTEKMIENVSSEVLWKSTLEDDGYRYVGTDPANYVCFGYSDSSTDCDFTNATNSDLYAYRIIGIFEDSSGEQHLKLIKKEALEKRSDWNADYQTDIDWDESDLYNGLNGSYFLSNTTYSYMQNINWLSKIANWDYTVTKTLSSYSDLNIQNIYLHEMNRKTKTITTGEWKSVNTKLGLMYVSDYLLSLGSSALLYTSSNESELKTGWMYIKNSDSNPPYQYEWTMTRHGPGTNGYENIYFAYRIILGSFGSAPVGGTAMATVTSYSIRPVFYLTSDVELTGEGIIDNPYIIEN